jgi:ADP-heptose:LPS heptosyltransferase
MKKKNKYKDYEIPFWGEWLEADCLKRSDMVEKLPIIKEISNIGKLPEKIRKHSFVLMINSFFEDLESAIYTKIELEKRKKK